MIRKLFMIGRDFTRQLAKDNISAYAASIAFFLFLSLFPMLLLICTIIPYTTVSEADLMRIITENVPEYLNSFVTAQIAYLYDKSPGVMSISAVVTVWSAAKGVLALMRGLNAVNGVVEDRHYILLRLQASVYTVIMLVATVFSLVIMVFGNMAKGILMRYIPRLTLLLNHLANFRFLFTWLVLTVFFTLLYTWIPNKKMRFKYQIPGAGFAAVAWSAFSYFFSIYVDRFNGFGMYGSLATISIIMVWLYCCMYIVMIGANMNRYFKPAIRVFTHREA